MYSRKGSTSTCTSGWAVSAVCVALGRFIECFVVYYGRQGDRLYSVSIINCRELSCLALKSVV